MVPAATESIRLRNHGLRTGIDAVASLCGGLGDLPPEDVRRRLDDTLAFLRHEVAPHARAEERVFYIEVARVLGVELGERMLGEHRYIGGLVNDLDEIRHRVSVGGAVPAELDGVLGDIVEMTRTHLRLEDEVLRRLADKMSDSEMYFLCERMEQAELEASVTRVAGATTAGIAEDH